MLNQEKRGSPDERLDALGRELTRAAGLSDEEVDRLATAPFLYTRIRARIEEERRRREQPASPFAWLKLSRAIPALILLAAVAAASLWFAMSRGALPADAAIVGFAETERPRAAQTCAPGADNECYVSNEEVISTLFRADGPRGQR